VPPPSVPPTLAMAVYTLVVRPFAPAHAWKGPVYAALLVLAAACAAVNAWAGALDLGVVGGPDARAALTAGAYTVIVLTACVLVALVGGIGKAMLQGVRDEEAATGIRLVLAQSSISDTTSSTVSRSHDDGRHVPLRTLQMSNTDSNHSGGVSSQDASSVASTAVLASTSTAVSHLTERTTSSVRVPWRASRLSLMQTLFARSQN